MAKLGALRAIAHNVCDSFGGGCGLLSGVFEMELYAEVARSDEGYLTLDFLSGQLEGAEPSASLWRAFQLYREALPALCEGAGVSVGHYAELRARFAVDRRYGGWFTLWVAMPDGRSAEDVYVGVPARRWRKGRTLLETPGGG